MDRAARDRRPESEGIKTRPPYERMTIHRDFIAAGQPRPYADTIYEAVLRYEFSITRSAATMRPARSVVERHARVLVHNWADEPKWHEARLKLLEEMEPNVWHVVVVVPYLD